MNEKKEAEMTMKNEQLNQQAINLLSQMNDLVLGSEGEAIRRIILLAATDIEKNTQSVQFVMNKLYNSVYQAAFHQHLTLSDNVLDLLKQAQKLSFGKGLFYASSDMRMSLYE